MIPYPDDGPEPDADCESDAVAAEDAADERAVQRRADRILAAAGLTAMERVAGHAQDRVLAVSVPGAVSWMVGERRRDGVIAAALALRATPGGPDDGPWLDALGRLMGACDALPAKDDRW